MTKPKARETKTLISRSRAAVKRAQGAIAQAKATVRHVQLSREQRKFRRRRGGA